MLPIAPLSNCPNLALRTFILPHWLDYFASIAYYGSQMV
jgi:hypothetical protein